MSALPVSQGESSWKPVPFYPVVEVEKSDVGKTRFLLGQYATGSGELSFRRDQLLALAKAVFGSGAELENPDNSTPYWLKIDAIDGHNAHFQVRVGVVCYSVPRITSPSPEDIVEALNLPYCIESETDDPGHLILGAEVWKTFHPEDGILPGYIDKSVFIKEAA